MTLGDYVKKHPQGVPLIYIILIALTTVYVSINPTELEPIYVYLKDYGSEIVLAVVIIMGIIMYLDMVGINLNPKIEHNINKIVTIETFDEGISGRIEKGFCKYHKGQTSELEKDCNTFTKDNCMATECCVWAKINSKFKCVAGDKNGPTFRSDDKGKDLDIDSYYFQKKCYGKCK